MINLFVTTFMCGGVLIFLGISARLTINHMEANNQKVSENTNYKAMKMIKSKARLTLNYMNLDNQHISESSSNKKVNN